MTSFSRVPHAPAASRATVDDHIENILLDPDWPGIKVDSGEPYIGVLSFWQELKDLGRNPTDANIERVRQMGYEIVDNQHVRVCFT